MYKQLAVALLALTMTLAVPVTVSANEDCVPPADETVLDEAGYYVTDTPAVFQESNGFDGLQSSAGESDCGTPEDESDDISWDADDSVL